MIRPDIIIAWPRNADYPVWRQYIRDHRGQFNEIIVVFTETHHGEDYRDFVRQSMFTDHVLFIDNREVKGNEDWRNVAVHQALLHSYNAPWIFFTEQDMVIKDSFWEWAGLHEQFGAMVVNDNGRMHPCGILIKREVLDMTQKEFGVVPDKSDHFSILQKDLEALVKDGKTEIINFPPEFYKHMNGLSHNLTLIYNSAEPNWEVEDFDFYLNLSLRVSVPQDSRYVRLVTGYLAWKSREKSGQIS